MKEKSVLLMVKGEWGCVSFIERERECQTSSSSICIEERQSSRILYVSRNIRSIFWIKTDTHHKVVIDHIKDLKKKTFYYMTAIKMFYTVQFISII